jgi:hypothetical protein
MDGINTKIEKLLNEIKYYKMMRYSRKGLCGWELSHWTKKLSDAEGLLFVITNSKYQ